MLISLSNKFIFIANLKTASTAIENALGPYCEIALVQARFGKHEPFWQIEAQFAWLLRLIDLREMFVFCVMRDPVDLMVSLYNSHLDPKFLHESPELYTGDLDFDQFLSEWTLRNEEQSRQQYLRLLDMDDCIAANYIINYDNIEEGLRFVSERIGIEDLVPLNKENESQHRLDRFTLNARHRAWIEARFAQDREVLNGYCDRLLTSRPQFASRHPGQTKSRASADTLVPELVRALYRKLLLRDPDPGGFSFHVTEIREGLPIEDAVNGMLRSEEFKRKHQQFSQTYSLSNTSVDSQ
jgi:hypothetical protein